MTANLASHAFTHLRLHTEFSINDGIGTVTAAKAVVTPDIGDTVLCEIVKLNEKNGEAQVICIEGKPGSVLPEYLYGQFHVTNIVDRYMHQTADAVRRRDVCRAEVKETSPVLRISFRDRDDCGVLHAICPHSDPDHTTASANTCRYD